MSTRVPQDVDLEDRLVFNLTPLQFGYLVIGSLGAAIVWKLAWAPSALRLACALPLLLSGAALAWGRWAGRGLDGWAADACQFARANVRFRWIPSTVPGEIVRARMRRRSGRVAGGPTRRRGMPRSRPPRLPGHTAGGGRP